MNMHVAMVSEHANPLAALGTADAGGQNVYVDALARHLAERGVQVDVYTRRDDARAPTIVEAAPGVCVHHVKAGPSAPLAKDEMFDVMPEFANELSKTWRWRPPDLIHAHFWMSGWAAGRARPLGVPLVQTFHALGSVKRRHQGAADTSPAARDAVERSLLAESDAVIATCREEVDELVALGGSAQRITIVPCGVDHEFRPIGPRHSLARERRYRVVCVGRMVPRKGIGDVIGALALLGADVELIVAGGPSLGDLHADEEYGRLHGLAEQAGVADRCRFVGSLDRSSVAALLRSADVVACTPWYEPFGIVPVEAMACGVPVVGTAVGGLRDTVCDGITGILVPPRDPAAIAAAVQNLLDDPARRRSIGAAGARRVERLYRWPTIAASVSAVYHSALAPRTMHAKAVTA